MEKEIGKTLAAVETAKQEVERKKEVQAALFSSLVSWKRCGRRREGILLRGMFALPFPLQQVSRQVKDAKATAQRNENELQHLASTTQHHRRQQAAVQERIRRIEAQVGAAAGRPCCTNMGSLLWLPLSLPVLLCSGEAQVRSGRVHGGGEPQGQGGPPGRGRCSSSKGLGQRGDGDAPPVPLPKAWVVASICRPPAPAALTHRVFGYAFSQPHPWPVCAF